MISAPIPENEAERLAVLHSYGVLDTPPQVRFDRITKLASDYFSVPISLVSLVDAERQWFKSAVGLEAKETHRDLAFCAHAIHDDEILVVEDAKEDERFATNPLVEGDPNIRFYAGAPLITESGVRLGTLCVIDREPRTLSPEQLRFLRDLSAVVMDEIELSAAAGALDGVRKMLADKNRSLDAFARALSHDLRGAISRIRGLCEFLDVEKEEGDSELVQHISGSADTALRLLTDLRGYFMAGTDEVRQTCDARACAVQALEALDPELTEAGASLHIGPLPTIEFAPGVLVTLFTNLVSNAVKYRASRQLQIEIGCEEDFRDWVFYVQDNGVGIPEDQQTKVFDLMVRLSRDRAVEGSGMGLSICQRIVEGAGGEIRVESKEHKGTRVIFSLPKQTAVGATPS